MYKHAAPEVGGKARFPDVAVVPHELKELGDLKESHIIPIIDIGAAEEGG